MSGVKLDWKTKGELSEYKKEFSEIIEKVKEELPSGYNFQYRLVGSAKRNLVLWKKDGNDGFDLDYQILLIKHPYLNELKNGSDRSGNSDIYKKIKVTDFKGAFDKAIKELGLPYNPCEDSTSSLTINNTDQESSKRLNSYDVVILLKEKNNDTYKKLIRTNKEENPVTYGPSMVKDSTKFNRNYKKIKENDMWNTLRNKYKEKKEKNYDIGQPEKKKSYSILIDATKDTLDKHGGKYE